MDQTHADPSLALRAGKPEVDSGANVEEKKWCLLNRFQRRVLGVLAEKAKTTPDGYPMTVAGITTGANQKSNRSPQMSLTAEQVENALTELRGFGAVTEVFGSGRVPKYRHHFYEWLGVRGAEAAVMIELMLRGEQTVGELRGRAARFDESIVDVAALKPVLEALIAKKLAIYLTPEGRGQMVTHHLYHPQELDSIKAAIARGEYAAPVREGQSEASSSATPSPQWQEQLQGLLARVARIEKELGIANTDEG
jgi:hypothetical protein